MEVESLQNRHGISVGVEESLLSQVTRAHSAPCEKPMFLNWMPLRCFSPKWSLRFQYNLSDKNTTRGVGEEYNCQVICSKLLRMLQDAPTRLRSS